MLDMPSFKLVGRSNSLLLLLVSQSLGALFPDKSAGAVPKSFLKPPVDPYEQI